MFRNMKSSCLKLSDSSMYKNKNNYIMSLWYHMCLTVFYFSNITLKLQRVEKIHLWFSNALLKKFSVLNYAMIQNLAVSDFLVSAFRDIFGNRVTGPVFLGLAFILILLAIQRFVQAKKHIAQSRNEQQVRYSTNVDCYSISN